MLAAVKFDYELGGARDEIADERTDWDLAVETDSCELTGAEMMPKYPFGVRRVFSEFARSLRRDAVVSFVQTGPPPTPPAGGRGVLNSAQP
jgi:hypothetical protein